MQPDELFKGCLVAAPRGLDQFTFVHVRSVCSVAQIALDARRDAVKILKRLHMVDLVFIVVGVFYALEIPAVVPPRFEQRDLFIAELRAAFDLTHRSASGGSGGMGSPASAALHC